MAINQIEAYERVNTTENHRLRMLLREVARFLDARIKHHSDIALEGCNIVPPVALGSTQSHVDFRLSDAFMTGAAEKITDELMNSILAKNPENNYISFQRLPLPKGVHWAECIQDSGVVLRGVADYHIAIDQVVCRFDMFYIVAAQKELPEQKTEQVEWPGMYPEFEPHKPHPLQLEGVKATDFLPKPFPTDSKIPPPTTDTCPSAGDGFGESDVPLDKRGFV